MALTTLTPLTLSLFDQYFLSVEDVGSRGGGAALSDADACEGVPDAVFVGCCVAEVDDLGEVGGAFEGVGLIDDA